MRKPYSHWAMPVKSYRWAIAATVTQWVKRASGYRLAVHSHHTAWEHAVGVR